MTSNNTSPEWIEAQRRDALAPGHGTHDHRCDSTCPAHVRRLTLRSGHVYSEPSGLKFCSDDAVGECRGAHVPCAAEWRVEHTLDPRVPCACLTADVRWSTAVELTEV